MTQQNDVASFLNSWTYVRGMTTSFLEAVPDEHWSFRASDKHGPLCKQFRHMVWVSDLYMNALRDAKIDLATKKLGYAGSTGRADLLAAMKERDERLATMLQEARFAAPDYRVEFFGTKVTFNEFTHVMIQHEAMHHGMWSVYAAQAGFEPPQGWKDDWRTI